MPLRTEIARASKRHVPDPTTLAGAETIAQGIPLTHFAARAVFATWSAWGAFRSPEARLDRGRPRNPAKLLEWRHNFFFAGPSCYRPERPIGDSAAFLRAGCEDGKSGGASPFDSGALIGRSHCLQPWRRRATPIDIRLRVLTRYSTPLPGWRLDFASWLAHCYQQPERYFDTSGSPWDAGRPDRTIPAPVGVENGASGRHRYRVAADRRAWTFEVRIAGEVTHDHLQAVLIPSQSLERALRWSDRVFIERRTAVHVEPLRFDVVADPDAIFRASGPLARRLCEAR